jgi:AraC family transcriptional regulator
MDYTESILAAIDYIEGSLFEELTLAEVAARIGFSEYHFHRVFHGMLGETMASYIRKRRISEAAKLLKTSGKSIFEIALLCRFETHESFTRAFKKIYGINPLEYKKRDALPASRHKEKMTLPMIEHLQTAISLKPRFEHWGPQLVVGTARAFSQGSFSDIERLWDAFLIRKHEILHAKKENTIGVCMGEHPDVAKNAGESFIYLAGVPVTELAKPPKGMVSCTIPKTKYAVFTHKGSLDVLPRTVSYIWGTWIPKNIETYGQSAGLDFELYDSRFEAHSRSGEFDIYVPVSAPC